MKTLAAILTLLIVTINAAAAQNVRQSGTITPGHAAMWITNGVVGDAGTAAAGNLTSLGVTNNGGPGICLNSGPITGAYNRLCLSVSESANAQISLQNLGGATAQALEFVINGTTQAFATVGLPTVDTHAACFTDTIGTMADCGVALASGMTTGQILIGQASGAPVWKTMAGDCTIVAAGTITCSASGSGTVTSGTITQVAQYAATGTTVSGVDTTGTGNVVRATSPTLTTPILGAAAATSVTASCGAACPGIVINGNVSSAPSALSVGVLLQLNGRDSATSAGIQHDSYGVAPQYIFRFANGTQASPTPVLSGESMGSIQSRGYGFSGYSSARSRITFQAAETWAVSDSNQGTSILFQTTPTSSNTIGNRVLIDGSGLCVYGSTSGTTCLVSAATASGTLTLPSATDTLVGKATTDTLTNKTLTSPTINGGTLDAVTITTSTWSGNTLPVTVGGTGQTAFTANLPVIGDGASSLAQGTVSGDTTKFVTTTGTLTPNDCVKIDGTGNFIAAGATCAGGAGTPGGSDTQVQYNNAGSFGGVASLTWVAPTLTVGAAGASTGIVALTGSTSGTISIKGQAAAGTYNFNLPTGAGTAGQALLSGGGGAAAMTFGTLSVAAGGTGATTFTSNMPLIGAGTSAVTVGTVSGDTTLFATASGAFTLDHCLKADAIGNIVDAGGPCNSAPAGSNTQVQFNNSSAFGASANLTWVSPALTIGVAGATTGQLKLTGSTSGTITIAGQAAAGTYNFNLPTGAGTAGQALLSGGGGAAAMTFGTLGVAAGGTGATTFTSNRPLIGNGTSAIAQGTVTSTNGSTLFAMFTGSLTSGDCVKIDTNGNLTANGAACGTSSPGGSSSYVQYNSSGSFAGVAGFTFNGTAALTLGVNATSTGTLLLANGGGSGQSVTIQNNAATSAYNFNLPSSAGSSGAPLLSAGGGSSPMTFGTLSASFGGTGQAGGYTIGDILYASSATALSKLASGASGTMLQSSGAASAPSWVSAGFLSTSLTTPIVYGGSTAGGTLSLRSTSSGAPSGDAVNMYTGGSLRMNLNASGNSSWTGSMTLSAGRFIQTYAPVYDLVTSAVAVAMLVGYNASSVTIAASKNLRGLWVADSSGTDFTITAGASAQYCGVCSTVTSSASTDSTGVVYGSVLHAINAGPGTTRGIHAGGFATGTSSGYISAIGAQIEPVATSAGAWNYYASLTSSGINDIATGIEFFSTGDRYAIGMCGGCISPLGIGQTFIHWSQTAGTSAGARFLRLYSSAGAEIFYVHKDGTVATLAGTVGAPSYSFTADTDTGMYRAAANALGLVAGGIEMARVDTTSMYVTESGGASSSQAYIKAQGTSTDIYINFAGKGLGGISAINPSGGLIAQYSNTAGATASTNAWFIQNSATASGVVIMGAWSGSVDTNVVAVVHSKGSGAVSLRSGAFVSWLDANSTDAATSATAGGVTIAGGVGVAKASWIGSSGLASGVVLSLQTTAGTCQNTPAASGTGWACTSDARLKRNIQDAAPAIPYLKSFRIRQFDLIATNQHYAAGVIAQEVRERHSEMVRDIGDEAKTLIVETPNAWSLVKAIQELSAANDSLKAANDNLRLDIEQLKQANRR